MNYKSRGESHSFIAPWLLPVQRETHMVGARRCAVDNGLPRVGLWDPPQTLLSLQDWGAASPECQVRLHTGLSVRTGNYHPEETWSTHCNESWTSRGEVTLVDLLTEENMEHPDGTAKLLENRVLGWSHLQNWWEWTTKIPQQLQKTSFPAALAQC